MTAKPLYCPQCGAPDLEYKIPDGDTRRRNLCGRCGYIIYRNPLMVAGAILEWEGKILLCKRAIKPRFGLWTLPAGFMENHETVEECARRECMEEANAEIEDIALFSFYSLPHVSQIYTMYSGVLTGGHAAPGPESSEVVLVTPDDIPWDEIAFNIIRKNLELYLEHGPAKDGRVHTGATAPRPGAGPQAEASA